MFRQGRGIFPRHVSTPHKPPYVHFSPQSRQFYCTTFPKYISLQHSTEEMWKGVSQSNLRTPTVLSFLSSVYLYISCFEPAAILQYKKLLKRTEVGIPNLTSAKRIINNTHFIKHSAYYVIFDTNKQIQLVQVELWAYKTFRKCRAGVDNRIFINNMLIM